MKTKYARIVAILTASLSTLSVAAQAATNDIKIGNRSQFAQTKSKQESTPKKKQSSPARTSQIDLRSKLANTHLHDGRNPVYSGEGVNLMAEVRNNKIVSWSATDDKGNKLPTTVEKDSAGKVKGITIYSRGRPQTLVFKIGRFVISN